MPPPPHPAALEPLGSHAVAQPMDRFRTFQIASGIFLAAYVLGHMNSVFVYARLYLGIDSDWAFATGAPGAAVLNHWRESPAAAINPDSPRIVEGIAPRPDVEDAGGSQPELWREGSGNQRYVADQRRIEERTEAADAVWKHDTVNPGLHIGVFVANMETAARRGVLV